MREVKLRQDLNSQVKLQKANDINITQGLAAPKYMQGDSQPYPLPFSCSLCQPCQFFRQMLGGP